MRAPAGEHTFAEQFGEQIESNWDKLRGKKPNKDGLHKLSGTPSLRLGAGRSLVRIQSPRLTPALCTALHGHANPSVYGQLAWPCREQAGCRSGCTRRGCIPHGEPDGRSALALVV